MRPDSVVVGNTKFEIKWQDQGQWIVNGQDHDGANGVMKYEDCYIGILTSNNENAMREVLLHEIQHAIWSFIGLIDHTGAELDDQEEYLITMTTPILLQVLRANPDVCKYLLAHS